MKKEIGLLLILGSIFFSCGDKTQINLVTGKLFIECETPLVNREVALKANTGGILASDISDADGAYNFTYELEEESTGTGDIILVSPQGFETLIENITLNEDILFNYYQEDSIRITVHLEGTRSYTETDTLFFGYNGTAEDFVVIQPVNGDLITIKSTLVGEFGNTTPRRVYYGIGEVDFLEAKDQTAGETPIRNIGLTISACDLSDTARIVIN